MNPPTIPEDYANAIWDALVKYAGASERWREDFLAHRDHITEYRFQGRLGFGGKFWNCRAWDVTCYTEDTTAEREEMIWKTNSRLRDLWVSYKCGQPPAPDTTT